MSAQPPLLGQVLGVEGLCAGWRRIVAPWLRQAGPLIERIEARQCSGAAVFPAAPLRALEWTPLKDCRVVILGQDPYHGPGQAEGLAFSVPLGQKVPPSLRNIFKELQRDLGQPMPAHGHLGAWARRGVLLLNSVLTVEEGRAGAHAGWGWELLTDSLIQAAADDAFPRAFLLWGAHAQTKRRLITGERHLVLQANHPSPLSALRPPQPFIGCGHFRVVSEWLASQGRDWDWSL